MVVRPPALEAVNGWALTPGGAVNFLQNSLINLDKLSLHQLQDFLPVKRIAAPHWFMFVTLYGKFLFYSGKHSAVSFVVLKCIF
jgi:hypothetical protein